MPSPVGPGIARRDTERAISRSKSLARGRWGGHVFEIRPGRTGPWAGCPLTRRRQFTIAGGAYANLMAGPAIQSIWTIPGWLSTRCRRAYWQRPVRDQPERGRQQHKFSLCHLRPGKCRVAFRRGATSTFQFQVHRLLAAPSSPDNVLRPFLAIFMTASTLRRVEASYSILILLMLSGRCEAAHGALIAYLAVRSAPRRAWRLRL